jgi:hypothetical protein
VFLGAVSLSTFTLHNAEAKIKVQNVIMAMLAVKLINANKPPDDDESGKVVQVQLDNAIESFFKKIIRNFISSWYSTISHDETFVWDVKVEITGAMRKLAQRLRAVRNPNLCRKS